MTLPVQDNIALFNSLHALLEDASSSESERRGTQRHAYPCVQLLALYDGVTLPGPADFQQVQCQDLSARGFSFAMPCPPEVEHVVIALGTVPFRFFTARIVRVSEGERDGRRECIMGCQFVRRITGADE